MSLSSSQLSIMEPLLSNSGGDASVRLKEDYLRWAHKHMKMKEAPPPDGRDYLAHASTLLSLLQGITEIHPIAKAVVSSFQTIIVFEQARRENDARVTAVFLAQTDMMRVLLDIDDLDHRQQCRADLEGLRSNAALGDTLYRMQQSIKACGNSIDTYYKESRFVKFWKAQDWKVRILGHVEECNQHRIQLQQILSIQVASGVNDLVSKMDVVLARLFSPKHDWEKDLDNKTRKLGSISTWMHDTNTLQSLISVTKDPALAMPAPPTADNPDVAPNLFVSVRLEQVQKELESSLDALCAKNLDWFNLKLDFQLQQIENSIFDSAQFVVHELSGPYDRLHHEELRQLWKEMNWIFCIENKFFASALFEYYLDRFSTTTNHAYVSSVLGENSADTLPPKFDKDMAGLTLSNIRTMSMIDSKQKVRSKSVAFTHPDTWTLEYIAFHGESIAAAIDRDKSGYIRISEVNTLTDQIPTGWDLPEWCAYLAAGWAYEARIYRKRINNLLFKLMEMQAHVLPNNRAYLVYYQTSFFDNICHAFWREPPDQKMPYIAPPLRYLVKNKIIAQDADLRSKLEALTWSLQDESAVHLIFGDKDPETYVLQMCAVMLEYALEIAFACCSMTIDLEEWERISSLFRVLRAVGVSRVISLTAEFNANPDNAESINTYYGGIWSLLQTDEDHEHYMFGSRMISKNYTADELNDYLSDIEILKDYSLPTLLTAKPLLHFIPWEEHVKTLEASDIPEEVPRTWLPWNVNYFESFVDRDFLADFPLSGFTCNRCDATIYEKRHNCLLCPGYSIDICADCFNLPPVDHTFDDHTLSHPVAYIALRPMPEQWLQVAVKADLCIEQIQQIHNAQKRSIPRAEVEEPDQEKEAWNYKCNHCSEAILADQTFYKCIGHSCEEYFMCKQCSSQRFEAGEDEHQWWHCLLALHPQVIKGELAEESEELDNGSASDDPPIKEEEQSGFEDMTRQTNLSSTVSAIIAGVVEKHQQMNPVVVEERLQVLEMKVEERMSQLESKMEIVMAGLQELLSRTAVPPVQAADR